MRSLIFTSCLLCSILCLSLNRCDINEEETVNTENKVEEYPSQEGWNSKIFLSKSGRLQAIVHYGHMKKFDKSKIYFFDEGVEVDFYDVDGNHTSHLTAEGGEYHEATEDVIGKGNVVVVSDSGLTLNTEELRWDNRLEKIISDTLIMLTNQEHDTLYGMGFESNADLSHRIIRRPWGASERKIDMEQLEESFSKPAPADTVSKQDSTEVNKK